MANLTHIWFVGELNQAYKNANDAEKALVEHLTKYVGLPKEEIRIVRLKNLICVDAEGTCIHRIKLL